MRLINSKTLQLHEFEQSSPGIPRYAILSHTWGDDEVTFHDMTSKHPAALARKKGYAKIWQTCRLAQQDNLEYVWIDTCCIDKSSSAELSESINSMFKWYANAAVCYVFLFDFELLAPDILAFYDAGWTAVGTKQSLTREISDITGIGQEILLRPSQIFLCSVSQRMSWAAFRETARIEDEAYCLLGIFGIHMPLLYGEGLMAFRRLQEEIIKRSADLTIFFWGVTPSDDGKPQYLSLFAESDQVSSVATGADWFVAKRAGSVLPTVSMFLLILN
ncbi:heterokaryon incompatibility protein-domain-containing protein [Xylaria grammica]|nr:heterokaryon incompatibility protein-domain-containing protein [Xylaria grammica]